MLQFIENKTRHDHRPANEPGLTDIGNAPVNDDAGVQQHRRLFRRGRRRGPARAEERKDVLLTQDHDDRAQVAKHQSANGGQDFAERRRQKRQGPGKERGNDQADAKANRGGQDLLGRDLPHPAPRPTRGHGREPGRQNSASHNAQQRQRRNPAQGFSVQR